jgi:hypothetical protein
MKKAIIEKVTLEEFQVKHNLYSARHQVLMQTI